MLCGRNSARIGLAGVSVVLAAALSGCADLPSSGPSAYQIVQARAQSNPLNFDIVDIAPGKAEPAAAGAAPSLSALDTPGAVDLVGPGDILQITIFEVGASLFQAGSGMSAAAAAEGLTSTGAAGVPLPPVTVDRDGAVILPYIGRLLVQGRTANEIQDMVVNGLKGKSQTPQAMVSVRESPLTTVTVAGNAKKPGRLPLSLARERVLDAIAASGGSNFPDEDTVLRLTRNGRSISERLDLISAASPDDIMLLPQDRLELLYRPRTFTIFGATKVSEVPFSNHTVSLAEAVARVGGPLDQQADPSAVFVFRYSQADEEGAQMPGARPVAYRLDLTRPESYFLAQRFEIHPHDVLYIANARADQVSKLFQILNLFFSPAYTAKVVAQ